MLEEEAARRLAIERASGGTPPPNLSAFAVGLARRPRNVRQGHRAYVVASHGPEALLSVGVVPRDVAATAHDRERLLGVIEAGYGDLGAFNEDVRRLFGDAPRAGSRRLLKSSTQSFISRV